ncbi:hypothetical protein [Amycolatopsis albispora]|uniref:VWFA domain-containing protein n=1 Tax=Amycolatopsis albispora TaxID=1804986 RepID=A0A344LJ55_9PSEU|nr:hypothetical protein [Amycolatopsis albispora]AXB48079.1 hypothetical protein A4R43_41250 [Amycolatopsis albispora]
MGFGAPPVRRLPVLLTAAVVVVAGISWGAVVLCAPARVAPNTVAAAPELFRRLPSADAQQTLTAFPATENSVLTRLGGFADPKRPLQLIGIGVGPDIDVAELREITAATGGQAFTTPDSGQINQVFHAALSKLACCA